MKKYLAYIVGIMALIALPTFFVSSTSASDNIDTTVNVEPSLTLSVSANTLNLNLDPSSVTFGYKDLDVIVGTNNATGYKLTMSTTSGNTNLVNTEDNTKVIETLPTLAGGYTDSTFIVNKWGYKKNRNTDNYNSFPATQTLLENDGRTNQDIANLRFGTKIDYLQESGTYATSISFNAVANPLVTYIQDFTTSMCEELASDANYTVVDKRDNNEYTVRYINGNCWMTRNLRFIGNTGSTSGTMTLDSTTSNIDSSYTTTNPQTISYIDSTSSDDSYNIAKLRIATADQVPSGATYTAEDMGVWYNYAAASAMTIIGSSNQNDQIYDICPKGWRLPTLSEQSDIKTYADAYAPITGGYYVTSGSILSTGLGYWWSSTKGGSTPRYYLYWDRSSLHTNYNNRRYGFCIRCIRSS